MYCYTIYRPSSFQISEFYLSETRKYCFPTSFDNFKYNYNYITQHHTTTLTTLHYSKHNYTYNYNYTYTYTTLQLQLQLHYFTLHHTRLH